MNIQSNIKFVGISLTIVFFIYSIILTKIAFDSQKDNSILQDNIKSLGSDIKYYRTKDSLVVAEKNVLTFKLDQFTDNFKKLENTVKDMNIKLKNVKSIQVTATETTDSINISWITKTINDTTKIKIGTYHDDFTDFVILGDNITYTIKDSLIQVVSDNRTFWRKLLFWKPVTLKQDIKSMNPNTTIKYMQQINIQ